MVPAGPFLPLSPRLSSRPVLLLPSPGRQTQQRRRKRPTHTHTHTHTHVVRLSVIII